MSQNIPAFSAAMENHITWNCCLSYSGIVFITELIIYYSSLFLATNVVLNKLAGVDEWVYMVLSFTIKTKSN